MISYTFEINKIFFTLIEENNSIIEIKFTKVVPNTNQPSKLILETKQQIEEYLLGKRKDFDFQYLFQGSVFEKKVLEQMKKIPYGKTLSYSELAEKAGYKNASRAVGNVCKNNKLPLLYPCHRVIRKNGNIGDFAGGRELKISLLELEKKELKIN